MGLGGRLFPLFRQSDGNLLIEADGTGQWTRRTASVHRPSAPRVEAQMLAQESRFDRTFVGRPWGSMTRKVYRRTSIEGCSHWCE